MKLVIDIPEEIYEALRKADAIISGQRSNKSLTSIIFDAIAKGTPLNKIKTEIEQIADEEQKHDEKWAIGLRYAVKIIDKYRNEARE